MLRHLAWPVASVLLVAACKKPAATGEQLLSREHAKLDTLATALERVATAPLPEPTGKIVLAGPPLHAIHLADTPAAGNATLVFDRDLAEDMKSYQRVDLRTSDTMDLADDCFMLARHHSMAGVHASTYDRDPMWDDAGALRAVPACTLLRYLVVVRLRSYDPAEYVDAKSYKGGSVAADALVFDLSTGTYAGGVAFTAESSDFTKSAAEADLANNFYSVLERAVQKQLPDAKL